MSYDFIDGKMGMLEKRVRDLAKRRSHAEHETQIALADLLFAYIDLAENHPWRVWKRAKWKWRVVSAIREHASCCPDTQDI